MYGNEFGMGKVVAVRSGYANKIDGIVTSYDSHPGHEWWGSKDLEVSFAGYKVHIGIRLRVHE